MDLDTATDELHTLEVAFASLAPEDCGSTAYYAGYRARRTLYCRYAHIMSLLEQSGHSIPQAYYDWAEAAGYLLEAMQPTAALAEAIIKRSTKY